MSKDFYYHISAIVNNIEDENKRVLEVKKKEFLKTELDTIKKEIKLNAQKYGKSMIAVYIPPDYIIAKLSIFNIKAILEEELEGFSIRMCLRISPVSFTIRYSGEAI